jgi:hypothetical protein
MFFAMLRRKLLGRATEIGQLIHHSFHGGLMTKMPTFYSVNDTKKDAKLRVHHDNSACAAGRDIPMLERRPGTNGYRLCDKSIMEATLGH